MRFERKKSNCNECPLRDRPRVWGEGPLNPEMIFVGEAPPRSYRRNHGKAVRRESR
jgi:uracil-DNA glycosylase